MIGFLLSLVGLLAVIAISLIVGMALGLYIFLELTKDKLDYSEYQEFKKLTDKVFDKN